MITLKKYETKDWLKINDAVEPFMFMESFGEFNKLVQRGIAITAIEDGAVMSCGGIAYINEKESLVWVKVSKKCLSQPVRYARGIRETFKLMIKSLGSMKIVTYIVEDFCKGERLAKMIGMKKVGKTYEFNSKMYNKYMVVT